MDHLIEPAGTLVSGAVTAPSSRCNHERPSSVVIINQ
jgi:hypothetical protein